MEVGEVVEAVGLIEEGREDTKPLSSFKSAEYTTEGTFMTPKSHLPGR